MARLQAYGFIDSFTNSLNPTIEGLQTKIKRWINAEVTSSQGPTDNMKCKSHAPFTARLGGRACSCARPAGVRVRKLPSPPARPAAVRMCVRPPGGRARAQEPARCPPGPLTPATSGRRAARGGTGAREGLLAGLPGSPRHCRAVCPPTHCRPCSWALARAGPPVGRARVCRCQRGRRRRERRRAYDKEALCS